MCYQQNSHTESKTLYQWLRRKWTLPQPKAVSARYSISFVSCQVPDFPVPHNLFCLLINMQTDIIPLVYGPFLWKSIEFIQSTTLSSISHNSLSGREDGCGHRCLLKPTLIPPLHLSGFLKVHSLMCQSEASWVQIYRSGIAKMDATRHPVW